MKPPPPHATLIHLPPRIGRPGVFTLGHTRDRTAPHSTVGPGLGGTGNLGTRPPLGSVLGMYAQEECGGLQYDGMSSSGCGGAVMRHGGGFGHDPVVEPGYAAEGEVGTGERSRGRQAMVHVSKVSYTHAARSRSMEERNEMDTCASLYL